jgi:cation:H+ antiporter
MLAQSGSKAVRVMAGDVFLYSLIFIASLAVLALTSKYVVESAIRLAEFFRIGEMATGFILLSVSTSLPESAVAVISAPSGEGAISIGNVFGSNIADVLLVVGLMALITGFSVRREDAGEFITLLFMTSVIPLALLLTGRFGMAEGIFLLFLFAGYSYYLSRQKVNIGAKERVTRRQFHISLAVFLAGIIVILISSDFAVQYAVRIAKAASIAESYIGATIIAVGTSLPEIAVDVTALRKGNVKLALGDALGSGMTNLTLILGVTGTLSSRVFPTASFAGLVLFLLLANMILWYFFDTGRRFGRLEGILMLAIYAAFVIIEFGLQRGI